MSAPGSEYRKGVYINSVIEAASRAGVRLSALTVLFYLCKWSKSYGPFVDQSKPQIMAELGLSELTVRRALEALTRLGILVPHENRHGGNGRGNKGFGVTRRLVILGRPDDEKGGKKISENGVKIYRKRGLKNDPLNAININQGKREGAASRSGPDSAPLDGRLAPATGGGEDPVKVAQEEAARAEYQKAAALVGGNPHKAFALVDQWRAEREQSALAGDLP